MYLLMAQARHLGLKHAKAIVHKLSYGDFFVLYHVGKNMNPLLYKDLVVGIYTVCSSKMPLSNYGASVEV